MTDNGQPLIAIDIAPIYFDGEKLNIIVGERQYEPFKGEYALPGVLLLSNETLEDAAQRALRDKIGYTPMNISPIKQVGAYDNTDRDPRGPTISILFYGVVRELVQNSQGTKLISVNQPEALPFDHNELVQNSLLRLSETAFSNKETLVSLLGGSFTTAAARNLSDELGLEMNQTNITRFLRGLPYLTETEETASTPGQKGRPSKVWRAKI